MNIIDFPKPKKIKEMRQTLFYDPEKTTFQILSIVCDILSVDSQEIINSRFSKGRERYALDLTTLIARGIGIPLDSICKVLNKASCHIANRALNLYKEKDHEPHKRLIRDVFYRLGQSIGLFKVASTPYEASPLLNPEDVPHD